MLLDYLRIFINLGRYLKINKKISWPHIVLHHLPQLPFPKKSQTLSSQFSHSPLSTSQPQIVVLSPSALSDSSLSLPDFDLFLPLSESWLCFDRNICSGSDPRPHSSTVWFHRRDKICTRIARSKWRRSGNQYTEREALPKSTVDLHHYLTTFFSSIYIVHIVDSTHYGK